MRHRRAAHGVGGRRDGAQGHAAGRPLVRLLSVDARQRADLQQRDRAAEDHLRRRRSPASFPADPGTRISRCATSRRSDRCRASPPSSRAASAKRGSPSGGRSRRTRRAPTCASSTCRSICRTRCRRPTRCEVGRGVTLRAGERRRARRLRAAADDQRVARGRRCSRRRASARPSSTCRGSIASTRRGSPTTLGRFPAIVTLDNHYVTLGQGVMVAAALARTGVRADVHDRSASPTCRPAAATPKCSRITASTPPRSRRRSATVGVSVCDHASAANRSDQDLTPVATDVSPAHPSLDRRRRGRRRRAARRSRSAARSTTASSRRSRAAPPPTCARGRCGRAGGRSLGPAAGAARGEILGRAAALLRASEREFGEIVQTETGKPWKNAVAEVASSADLARLHGERRQPLLRQDDDEPDRRIGRCGPCARRSASARRSCRSTARWPASPGRCFRRSCAATPSWPSRTS